MDGLLLVPPDRVTIIGKPLWKSRFVVVSGPPKEEPPQQHQQGGSLFFSRSQLSRGLISRDQATRTPECKVLSVYKTMDDAEPLQQYALSSLVSAQVQMMVHRKADKMQPTLVVTIGPDASMDKLRKRRSSRSAGLASKEKDLGMTTLWFRLVPDEQTSHSLDEWALYLQSLVSNNPPERTRSHTTPTFTNPLSPIRREANTQYSPHGSGKNKKGLHLQHAKSTRMNPGKDRERSGIFSESISLRSRRSDVSSKTNFLKPSLSVIQNYISMHQSDSSSPATTSGEHRGDLVEGRTSGQGKSSTLSSPVRGRERVRSAPSAAAPPAPESTSPPIPRETILDRAFHMRCIPGSERETHGEKQLSSVARFEALMQDMDRSRIAREAEARAKAAQAAVTAKKTSADSGEMKSACNDKGSCSDEEAGGVATEDNKDVLKKRIVEPQLDVSPRAQRAFNANATPHENQQTGPTTSTNTANHDGDDNLETPSKSVSSHHRPRTGYANRNRPRLPPRTHSQPNTGPFPISSTVDGPPPSTIPNKAVQEASSTNAAASTWTQPAVQRGLVEKRLSTSSMKRLSFGDFTKRLSSTSSLLLVQSNASATSSRGSTEIDAQQLQLQQQQLLRGCLQPRGLPSPTLPPPATHGDFGKICSWRSSMGFGSEGGFL